MSDMQRVNASVRPEKNLSILSQYELARLQDKSGSGLYQVFRKCALAVLNCGSNLDDTREVLEVFKDFDIHISQKHRGIQLELINAPASAFVDGEIIKGIGENLFAVLRDLLYVGDEIDLQEQGYAPTKAITNEIFHILRHANALTAGVEPNMVVCWGGHSISREEYDYTKAVGYELGLRGIDVCTGCGPGAMKGPMKGATIAHAKQRNNIGRYVGISEPGIIAAESPNPIVNELIIMPDIEKRLEAFVRLGHGIIVFPGGAGTAEEILYLLGLMLDEKNRKNRLPVIFAGKEDCADYWQTIDRFIGDTLGEEAQACYQVILGDPADVARQMSEGLAQVTETRRVHDESFHFNWGLNIDYDLFQKPFIPTHENMATLALHRDQPAYILAANLRRALSGIVAGNVKETGIKAIEDYGPFELHGESGLMKSLDEMLQSFTDQRRMKLNHEQYRPCYRINH